MKIASIIACICLAVSVHYSQEYLLTDEYLLFSTDFEDGTNLDAFAASDPAAWKINQMDGNHVLELYGKSNYRARVRSPFNIAVLKEHLFGDFTLEVKLKQTGRDYGHRDMCLFFGMQNSTNFYYVHIATAADPHAHNIFLVNDEPRRAIALSHTNGVDWKQDWHTVRIRRELQTGLITVYFDDFSTPIMTAIDTHFMSGNIGFGSFDDTGMVDEIKIWGPAKGEAEESFFD